MEHQSSNGCGFGSTHDLEKLRLRSIERMDSAASSSGLLTPDGLSPGGAPQRASRRHRTEPFLIGVAGGTASGKTTVCDQIVQRLNGRPTFSVKGNCFSFGWHPRLQIFLPFPSFLHHVASPFSHSNSYLQINVWSC